MVEFEFDVLQLSWSGNDLYDAATDGVRCSLASKGSRSDDLFFRLERFCLLLDLDMVMIWCRIWSDVGCVSLAPFSS
jgi:hypothetical protein